MTTPRRKFDKDFKLEAVKMVVEGGLSRAEVGRRLGINQNQIGSWVRAFESEGIVAFPGNGKLKPDESKVKRLEKENKDLKEEIAFLKKTAVYFASQKK